MADKAAAGSDAKILFLGHSLWDAPVDTEHSRPDAWSKGPRDIKRFARSTPAGRRLRALQRAVVELGAVPLDEARRRCRRAAPRDHAPGDHLDILLTAVLGATLDTGHLQLDEEAGSPVLVPGPAYTDPPGVRRVDFADPMVSVLVGAYAALSDPISEWCPSPAGISTIALPHVVMREVAVAGTVDLEAMLPKLLTEVVDHDPRLGERLGEAWIRDVLRAVLVLLCEFGWVSSGPLAAGRLPEAAVTRLGVIGMLMLLTEVEGQLPEPIQDLLRDAGYLRAKDGYVAPDDVPAHVSPN